MRTTEAFFEDASRRARGIPINPFRAGKRKRARAQARRSQGEGEAARKEGKGSGERTNRRATKLLGGCGALWWLAPRPLFRIVLALFPEIPILLFHSSYISRSPAMKSDDCHGCMRTTCCAYEGGWAAKGLLKQILKKYNHKVRRKQLVCVERVTHQCFLARSIQ